MDVRREARLWLRRELGKVPVDRTFHRAVEVEPPALAGDVGRQAEVERRPILCEMLSRRQTLLFRPGGFAGQEAALARPAFLASRQLGGRGRFVLVGHVANTSHSWRCIAD